MADFPKRALWFAEGLIHIIDVDPAAVYTVPDSPTPRLRKPQTICGIKLPTKTAICNCGHLGPPTCNDCLWGELDGPLGEFKDEPVPEQEPVRERELVPADEPRERYRPPPSIETST